MRILLASVTALLCCQTAICVAQEPDSYGLTGVKRLQFEATLKPENYERNKSAWEKSGNTHKPPLRYDLNDLSKELVMDFPSGRVVTYDQIHRICGELVKNEQIKAKVFGENLLFIVEIQPFEHGQYTYSRLRLDVVLFVVD